jgi:hypothetical protein
MLDLINACLHATRCAATSGWSIFGEDVADATRDTELRDG